VYREYFNYFGFDYHIRFKRFEFSLRDLGLETLSMTTGSSPGSIYRVGSSFKTMVESITRTKEKDKKL
jgi:hypothetical protein